MKIIKSKIRTPVKYKFKFELSQEEAIGVVNELGKMKCTMDSQRAIPIPKEYWARIFMTLSDTLQDLGLIPMIEGRRKGKDSYPRLENDEIIAKEIKDFVKQEDSEVKG